MERIAIEERPHWQEKAEEEGFKFHTFPENAKSVYWDERAYYRFSLQQIENDIEDPTQELHAMCLQFVDDCVDDDEVLRRMQIPEWAWQSVRDSWHRNEPSLYGRMDFAYTGQGPAKFLEYNADTPTSVYETAYFQWGWLEDSIESGRLPAGADQYNALQDQLIAGFSMLPVDGPMHFVCAEGSEEDWGTISYLAHCASLAGHGSFLTHIHNIGADRGGNFLDPEGRPVRWLFKLYPWEWMQRELYMKYVTACDTHFFEPPWKAMLSNKALLAYLWKRHPGHPNLLPAFFEDERGASLSRFARKPIFAREGANVRLQDGESVLAETGGEYGEEGFVVQELTQLYRSEHGHALVGSWVANNVACGVGIREDDSIITGNDARYVPHAIVD